MARRKKAALRENPRSGIWQVRYIPPGGTYQDRREVSTRTTDPVDAEIERRRIQGLLDRGIDPQAEQARVERENRENLMSLSDLWPDLQRRHFGPLSPHTVALYKRNYNKLSKAVVDGVSLVDLPMMEITKGMVHAFVDLRLEQGCKIATANRDVQFLHLALAWAVQQEHIPYNPIAGIKKGDENNRRDVRNIQPADLLPLLDALPPVLADICEMSYLTWRRIGAVMSLRIEDVREVQLPKPAHLVARYYEKGHKGSGKWQEFPLSSMATEVFNRNARGRSEGWVFVVPGTTRRYSSLHKTFDRHVRRLGLAIVGGDKLDRHDLRRLASTDGSRRSLSEAEIAEGLGHSRKTVTGRYATPRPVPLYIFEDQTPIRKAAEKKRKEAQG